MEEKRRSLWGSRSSSKHHHSDHSEGSNPVSNSSEEEFKWRPSRHQGQRERSFGDFKVDLPEFEGQLDPDVFLDWLQNVFDYKDIPEGKKIKLVALKLRKSASIWWSNVVTKRQRKAKSKIKTWEQMKSKHKAKFLPPHYLQDNFLKLHHLKQGSKSVEEYTRDFEQLLLKCDFEGEWFSNLDSLFEWPWWTNCQCCWIASIHLPWWVKCFSSQGWNAKETQRQEPHS